MSISCLSSGPTVPRFECLWNLSLYIYIQGVLQLNLLKDEQNISLGAVFLVLNENSQNCKNKLLVRAATDFPAKFSRSKHDSVITMFTTGNILFELIHVNSI